jgi:hypothetical protein
MGRGLVADHDADEAQAFYDDQRVGVAYFVRIWLQ